MAKTKTKNTSKQEVVNREEVVLQQIREFSTQSESGYVYLMELLSEAYHNRYYSSKWGYEKFNEFADTETNTGYRKAMQLIKVYDTLVDMGINDMERLVKIGWTKLREMIKIVGLSSDNIDEYLDDAEKMTYKEVEEQVKISRDDAGIVAPNKYSFKFTLGDENGQMFNEAIDMAKTMYNVIKMEDAVISIVMDWMQSQSVSPEALPLEAIISYVQHIYGVSLVEGKAVAEKPAVKEPEPEVKKEPEVTKKEVKVEEKKEPETEPEPEYVTDEMIMKMKKGELIALAKDNNIEIPADHKKVGEIRGFILGVMESSNKPESEATVAEETIVAPEIVQGDASESSIDDLLNL